MANWIFDDIAALLTTTTVIDGKVVHWNQTLPFVRVDETNAATPSATANESSFNREYSAVLSLFAVSDTALETLIETCYTAFSGASDMYNPARYYERYSGYGYKSCKMDITKEELILPGAV